MFQSHAVTSQWDTWAFVENNTYYAYYLITEHSPGEGFGVATSADGVHWDDHGYVWHGPSWAEHRWWEGTGSVWRAPDFNATGRYIINYSQYHSGTQNITFAQSFDLIHWERTEALNNTWFNIDHQYYHDPGRWDCIYSIPVSSGPSPAENLRDGYPRYGFWTASPISGTMGFGVTEDGVNWKALPSPEMIPPAHAEVGAVEYIPFGPNKEKGAFFAILGAYHMETYTAQDPKGPWHAATKNFEVLPNARSCYFARFFRAGKDNEDVLVTHQSFSHVGRTYIAPYKVADVDDEGTLRFKYWANNEAIKGPVVDASFNQSEPHMFSGAANVSVGAVFEAAVTPVPNATAPLEDQPGFWMETVGGGAVVALINALGQTTLATVAANASSAAAVVPKAIQVWDRDLVGIEAGAPLAVRLLYRRDMMELYVNDFLMPVYLMPATTGRIGVMPKAKAQVQAIKRWDMSLP